MKTRINQYLLSVLIICSIICRVQSQDTWENGYYIDSSLNKVNCLIKNVDWKDNPTSFLFKLSEEEEQQKASIRSVVEFGISNDLKYIKSDVLIDRSSSLLTEMSTERTPVFEKETHFLKVLVEGKASLFSYENGELIRYFYKIQNTKIEQLIYKSYRTIENEIAKNETFKRQIWVNLKCDKIPIDLVENLRYTKSSLVKYFVRFNECSHSEFSNYTDKKEKDLFNLTFRSGMNNSSFIMGNNLPNWKKIELGNEWGLRYGIESEFILPYKNNKWHC